MNPIDDFRQSLPDYAKDIRINLVNVLTPEGSPGLDQRRILGIALASAYASRNADVIEAVGSAAGSVLAPQEKEAAKAAATVMAMNNVYYRFLHLVSDPEYRQMPAKLRMTVVGAPGIDKKDFELYALAVSAVNGCGMCIDSHARQLSSQDVSKEAVQSAVRIAAVIQAAAQARSIEAAASSRREYNEDVKPANG